MKCRPVVLPACAEIKIIFFTSEKMTYLVWTPVHVCNWLCGQCDVFEVAIQIQPRPFPDPCHLSWHAFRDTNYGKRPTMIIHTLQKFLSSLFPEVQRATASSCHENVPILRQMTHRPNGRRLMHLKVLK